MLQDNIIDRMKQFNPQKLSVKNGSVVGIYESVDDAQKAYFACIQFDAIEAVSVARRCTVFLP